MSEPNFKSIKLYPNMNLLVDIDFIRKKYFDENGILNGAKIFAILFKLIQAENFAPSTDSDINLKDFHITTGQWILLYGFIKNGFLPLCNNNNEFINQLNKCYECTLKLGGIPSFDLYYLIQMNSLKEKIIEIENYNPMTPEADHLKKYKWGTYNALSNQTLTKNQSITIPVTGNMIFYCREILSKNI